MVGLAGDADISNLTIADFMPPEERGRLEHEIVPSLSTKGAWAGEFRLRRFDGRPPVHVLYGAYAVHDDSGTAIALAMVARDIEQARQAARVLAAQEAELRRLNEGLEAQVRHEVAAREQAQVRLAQAQRMEALGQLAGGVAHDFNNVLQAVQGGVRLIENRPDDPARVRRLATMVAEAATRGASITRRLLAFSRRADLRAEPVDVGDLLTSMREIFTHTLGAGIDVRVQVPASLPALFVDKGQLETVLVNLAANARDAMAGAGVITLAAVADRVEQAKTTDRHAAPLEDGAYVRLSVSDTGAGMDSATLARAAEPFFTTKPQGKGTGLGLAMARGFVEQSGGAMDIESAPGSGTTVRMWLPVATGIPTAASADCAVKPASPGDARPRVLLVDDEELVRAITSEGLAAAGYVVLSACSGEQALERLDAGETVHLIVTDLSMPGLDGLALIREAQRRRPGLPAILLTGFATDMAEIAVGGALNGSFSLLRKPVEARVLAERVAVLLEGTGAGMEGGRRAPG